MAVRSLFTSSSSKAYESSKVPQVNKVSKPDSMGIKASSPNVRAYGVSPVRCFGVVQYA